MMFGRVHTSQTDSKQGKVMTRQLRINRRTERPIHCDITMHPLSNMVDIISLTFLCRTLFPLF